MPEDYEELDEARRRREGQDRDRALRPELARHQAEGGGGARRGRLHHLLRSARRRLLRRATSIPKGPFRPAAGRAARQRDGHADLSRRSADAGLGVGARARKRLDRARRDDAPEDSGAADLLRRRAAAAAQPGGPGRARRLARRAADHVSRRRRAGEGAPQAGVRLAARARSTTSSPASPGRAVPDQWVDPRQPPRRVGERRVGSDQRQRRADGDGARARRAAEDRLAPEAHDHPRVLGRRGVGPARLDRMGREARGGARGQGRRLHQQRQHRRRAGSSVDGSHSLQAFVNEVARDVPGSARLRQERARREARRAARARRRTDEAKASIDRAATSRSGRSARGPTTPPSSIT